MSLFDKTTNALGSALDFRLLRQNVISGNIANAETPGYHAQKVDFEDQLSRALQLDGTAKMAASHSEHFPMNRGLLDRVQADIYDDPDIPINNDKNTVDLEKEMSRLAENTIMYRTAVELIKKKLGAMKYAISEGR